MSKGHPIPASKKEAILKRIKEDGISANRAANDEGVSPKTVYNWLSKQTTKSGIS